MIDRIYVGDKVADNRRHSYIKSFASLGLSGKVKDLKIISCYLVAHDIPKEDVERCALLLANPVLEKYSVNDLKAVGENFDWVIEIGFLPGVTDNVAQTTKEAISDFLHVSNESLDVYSSKVFLISGKVSKSDVDKIALSLHNPLIESSYILDKKTFVKEKNLPMLPPMVRLDKNTYVATIPLDVSDDELTKIGSMGIMDRNGIRRGPLALDLPSMKVIKSYFESLNRNPTDIELESLAQTWSEHCKHTIFANPIDDIKDGLYKTYIKGATKKIREKKGSNDFCVSVFSDNSGAVVFDEDYLITHKIETHNSPSALDPYGGAMTGIVGVNRDTLGFGLGAKPVANLYGFCVGNPSDKKAVYRDKEKKQKMFPPKRILDGVIKGVNAGGNTSGIPTTSGFVKYDDRYKGKPLVFAGTVGIIPRKINKRKSHEKRAQAGDYIVVIGGRVGADGIHGATFSSTVMDSGSPATAVQIGDPITQKKLSDAIIREARQMDLYSSITDNGAGGISCSVAEMARECGGAIVHLDKVPLKYPGLQPWQIWISESQERMTLSVPKKKWKVFNELMQTRGVEATIIGEFTESPKCQVYFGEKKIMDMEMEFLHNGLPKHQLHTKPFEYKTSEPKILPKKSYTDDLLALLRNGNVGGYSFISEQYDHEVQASSVLKPLSGAGRINTDAQVFRPILSSPKGAVLSESLYPSYGDISAYHMAAAAIDTAIRNTIAAGGTLKHLSILDNFCWCSSNDETRLSQLVEAVRACYDFAIGYGTPFISGKDSMFNDFKGYDEKGNPINISIPPTLLISAISVTEDILKTVSPEFKTEGDLIYVLGDTNEELGGSEYFRTTTKEVGTKVPKVDIAKNTRTYQVLEKLIDAKLIVSSMSVTSGGLSVALAKASVGGMIGCEIDLAQLSGKTETLHGKLFSESQGRIVVSVPKRNKKEFEKITKNIPITLLGTVKDNKKFILTENNKKLVDTRVDKLFSSYHELSNQLK